MPRPVVPMAFGAARLLARLIERHVRGQDQRAVRRDPQPLEHRHALLDELLALVQQRLQRQHHAVADEAARPARAECPEGISDSTVFLPPMTSVWPALWPPWKRATARGPLGQQVDDLALAFIAPLGADDDDELAHAASPVDQEQKDYADEHAAQPAMRNSRSCHRQQPREGALDSLRVEKRHDAFQHQNTAPSAAPQVGEVQGTPFGLQPASDAAGLGRWRDPSVPEEFAVGRQHQHIAVLAEGALVGLQAAVEGVELRVRE